MNSVSSSSPVNVYETNLPFLLDNTSNNISLLQQKILECASIPTDLGRFRKLHKIYAKLIKLQNHLESASNNEAIEKLHIKKEEILYGSTNDAESLERKITEIKQMRESKKFIKTSARLNEVIKTTKFCIDCLEKTAFNEEKVLSYDFTCARRLLEDNYKILQEKAIVDLRLLSNDKKYDYLKSIKNKVREYLDTICFITLPTTYKILKEKKRLNPTEYCWSNKLHSYDYSREESFPSISSNFNRLYQEVDSRIAGIKTLNALKNKALAKSPDVETLKITSRPRDYEVYLPKDNLKLSEVLDTAFKDQWLCKKNAPIDVSEYSFLVSKEFFDYLATELPPHFTKDSVMAMLHIANRFDVPSLITHCLDYIKKNADLNVIPELMQMGYDFNRKELINCCEKMVEDHIQTVTKEKIANSAENIWMKSLLITPRKENHDHLAELIPTLLMRGVQRKQKELLWFAIRLFVQNRNLINQIKFPPNTKSNEWTISTCQELLKELLLLDRVDTTFTFSKELGKIEIYRVSKNLPSLLNLSFLIPLTLNIGVCTEKDYFAFVAELVSQKIPITVNMPVAFKKELEDINRDLYG